MQRHAIEEASYLMNLVIKELADTKFVVLFCNQKVYNSLLADFTHGKSLGG